MQMKDLFKKEPVHVKLSLSDINWILNGKCKTQRRILFVVRIMLQLQEAEHCCEMTYSQLAKCIQVSEVNTRKQVHKLEDNGVLFVSESKRYYDATKFKYGDVCFGMVFPIRFVADRYDITPYEYDGVINEKNFVDLYTDFTRNNIRNQWKYLHQEWFRLFYPKEEEAAQDDNHQADGGRV